MDGWSPDWATARVAVTAASKESKVTAAAARNAGRSTRRIQASVITPRVPSEPAKRRSGAGPAPLAGSRRVSITPRGVRRRSDSTRSSMWVARVAWWPAARVAIQPPRVENSNDWG